MRSLPASLGKGLVGSDGNPERQTRYEVIVAGVFHKWTNYDIQFWSPSPSMNTLWRTGGFLTNSHSPKKFRSRRKKIVFGPTQPPDCLVVFDSERKSSVILEAHRLQVPIVSLVDSDMPIEYYNKITYPIPCNSSVQFVYLFCNLITKTFMLQQKKSGADSAEIETSERVGVIEKAKSVKKDEVLMVPSIKG